jgi:hypothetical protein
MALDHCAVERATGVLVQMRHDRRTLSPADGMSAERMRWVAGQMLTPLS